MLGLGWAGVRLPPARASGREWRGAGSASPSADEGERALQRVREAHPFLFFEGLGLIRDEKCPNVTKW